mgnify:FL=1
MPVCVLPSLIGDRRTKDVDVNGYRVTVRYNDTCHFYQPPRAHHCSVNDNCIERFDHHCPWVGTTVGKVCTIVHAECGVMCRVDTFWQLHDASFVRDKSTPAGAECVACVAHAYATFDQSPTDVVIPFWCVPLSCSATTAPSCCSSTPARCTLRGPLVSPWAACL